MPATFEQITEYKADRVIPLKEYRRHQAALLRRSQENRLTDDQLERIRATDTGLYEYFITRRKQEKR